MKSLVARAIGLGLAAVLGWSVLLAQEGQETPFDKGVAAYEAGKLDEARQHFEQALQASPNDYVILTWAGTVALEQQDYDAAISYLQKALKAKPDYHVAHNNLANAYAAKGDQKNAEEHYQAALKAKPDYFE
ncbi:MAG: tetratricopeptide repeat protein, partial [Armatimonadetes bacterium]|nr:tetratricopeptide repeat protein [Armatimonadota bacterium]